MQTPGAELDGIVQLCNQEQLCTLMEKTQIATGNSRHTVLVHFLTNDQSFSSTILFIATLVCERVNLTRI